MGESKKMRTKPVDNISFGYKSILKTNFIKGKLPSVKYGFYGDKLNKKNVSIEHLKPKSKGGKSALDNFVLASKEKNQLRGNQDIRDFAKRENILNYLYQFMGIKLPNFNGDKYIADIISTLNKLGIDLTKGV